MSTYLYGISNCDTVKKARRWLDQHEIDYQFHDLRKDGLDGEKISFWINKLGLDTTINKRSTTWRNLPEEIKAGLNDQNAIELLLEQPTLIKRPVLEHQGQLSIGFKADQFQDTFGQ